MTTHELELRRIYDNKETTIGYMLSVTESILLGFVCEDQHRDVKVKTDTRIWAGKYKLVLNKVLTGKTQEYRNKFSWFTWHIMLEDVKNFQGVYIHIGNFEKDTDACLLIGDTVFNINNTGKGQAIANSTIAFERFYKKYQPLLEAGTPIYLTIIDEP